MKNFFCQSAFDDLSFVHDRHILTKSAYNIHIVADEQNTDAVFDTQSSQKRKDLLLHGHIQSSGRLIADKKFRVDDHGRSDNHALALPSGELMGVFAVGDLGLGQAYLFHNL